MEFLKSGLKLSCVLWTKHKVIKEQIIKVW